MNERLRALYEEDLADARTFRGAEAFLASQARRGWVEPLLAAGALETADDYFHASFVFQHGERLEHWAQAHLLARTAAEQPPCEPQAYVILRGAQGLGAIGGDQARRLVELRPEEIVPAPADDRTVVAGVAALGEGRLLRIIAADRLWSGA